MIRKSFEVALLFSFLGCWAILPSANARGRAKPRKAFVVAVVADGPLKPESRRLLATIEAETKALLRGLRPITFAKDKQSVGDWRAETVRAANSRVLADPDVDLVITMGPLSLGDMAQRVLKKPVLAPWAGDPRVTGLPLAGRVSGKKNLNYLVYASSFREDLRTFSQLVRQRAIHVLVDELLLAHLKKIPARAKALSAKLGLTLKLVPAKPTAEATLQSLPKRARAVYLTPLVRMSNAERGKLIAGINDRKLPSFSSTGRVEVEQGVLATQARGVDFLRAARRTAINVERVVRGEDPGKFSIYLQRQRKLLINMATARTIGFSPRWRVLVYAERFGEASARPAETLSLAQAVQLAVTRTYDVLAAGQRVAAQRKAVAAADGPLYPQIDLAFQHQTLHKKTAEASNGSQPWHQGKAVASLSQTLFVEPLFAARRIQRALLAGARAEKRTLQLDIAAAAAYAFLDLLRASVAARIQQNNARLTDEYLEGAKTRKRVGVSAASDVHRWQSQLASARNQAVLAQSRVEVARLQLNKLLRRPLHQGVVPRRPGPSDPSLVAREHRLRHVVDTPRRYRLFADFLVKEGRDAAEELKQLDALIAAKRREHLSLARALYLPRLQLSAEMSYIGYRKFTDAQPISIPGLGDMELALGSAPRFSFFVGAGLSLPIFRGFQQSAQRDKASAELRQLEYRRKEAELAITLRIRAALAPVRAAAAGIHFAQTAANAAKKNLTLVQDAYNKGVSTTVTLLDAQNAALSAELSAATAVIDFQRELVRLQRAIGRFRFFVDAKARDGFLERLRKFFVAHGQGGSLDVTP